MAALGRGQSSGCTNPVLQLFTPVGGVLYDVDSLEFIVLENISAPGTPVQVFPVAGRQTIDVTQDCPLGGRLGLGHYVADYTVGMTDPAGEYIVQFFFRLTPTSPEQTFSYTFQVLPVVGSFRTLYTTIAKVRACGAPTAMTDADILDAIAAASEYVDRVTGRHFAPEAKQICIDGNCAKGLLLDEVIIAVSEVLVNCCDADPLTGSLVDPSCYRDYNRHITKNLRHPDDREHPRIDFCNPGEGSLEGFHGGESWRPLTTLTGGRWPKGKQNIIITGIFGYTDYDGGPVGKTPDLICRVTAQLALRYCTASGSAAGADAKWQATFGARIKSEKTADQSYTLFSPAELSGSSGRGGGSFTGDPEIDNILVMYKRPPLMAGV